MRSRSEPSPAATAAAFIHSPYLSSSVLSLEESVRAMSLSPEEDDIPWDTMRDNRDLTVFTSWDPKDRSVPSSVTCVCVVEVDQQLVTF